MTTATGMATIDRVDSCFALTDESLYDLHQVRDTFLDEAIAGLNGSEKTLPCKFFYDRRGSLLFDQICELEEYYPTRTEMAIMYAHAGEMASCMGHRCLLIEYGSGTSMKTRLLLAHLEEPSGYVPIDICREHLLEAASALRLQFPGVPVLPICGDYTDRIFLPSAPGGTDRRVVYFPGSTIGNFHPEEAQRFLRSVANLVGSDGGMLIGVDLKKDPRIINAAYNDSRGITAQFNLNLLARMNADLGADFVVNRFRHIAFYNEVLGRIEMHILSLCDQQVCIGDCVVGFKKGETIWTESSYKYSLDEFEDLSQTAGWRVDRVWTDADTYFSVQYLTAT